jgi:hypothetical protein
MESAMTQILAMLAFAFTISGYLVSHHIRGGGIMWLGWLAGATTVGMLWSWWA